MVLLALGAERQQQKAQAERRTQKDDASREPLRPDTLTVDFYEEADALVIHTKRGGGPWGFLLFWLIPWTVGCVLLLVKVIDHPSPGLFAFATSFWAAWLLAASLLVWSLFGKETLLLRRDQAYFSRTALVRLWSCVVPRKEILAFRECRSSNYSEDNEHLWAIEMVTLGKPVQFAFWLPDRERAWLIYQLNRFLGTSAPSEEGRGAQEQLTVARSGPHGSREPARPERLTIDFYEEPDALVIHKKGGGGPWPSLVVFLAGWTLFCLWLVVAVIDDPSPGLLAFAMLFCAAWLLLASVLVWALFGKETVVFRRDEAYFSRRVLVRLWSRVVPREQILGFREFSYKEKDEYLWIEMVTVGKPVRFAFGLPDRERTWLIHQLNRFLGTSVPCEGVRASQPEPTLARSGRSEEGSCSHRTRLATEVLTLSGTLAEPPTDCDWRLTEDAESIAFWQKGRWSIRTIVVLLFMKTFLGVLATFAALVLAVLERFRRTTWRFEPNRIVKETCWPARRQTRTWEVVALDRLELRRRDANHSPHKRLSPMVDLTDQTLFELAVVSSNNTDVCVIGNLTEGEARWMARILLDGRLKVVR